MATTAGAETRLRIKIGPYIGWILTILLPLTIFFLTANTGLQENARMFLGILGMAIVMWLFNTVPFLVPALLILLITILLDIAPKETVLSGFMSEGFILCLGVFVMSAQIFSSGLVYRFALLLLRIMPSSSLSQNLIIFLSGGLLTVFLPSPMGRSALVTPLMFDMIDSIPQLREKKINITPLLISGMQGVTLLTTIFLTGNPLNLVMLDFFNPQTRYRFQWVNWLISSVLVGVILLAGYLIIANWQTRKSNIPPMSNANIDAILKKMGPMTTSQWVSLIALAIFVVGVFTVQYHGIQLVWLSFGIALALFLYGAMTMQELKTNVDWPVLLFISALISWTPIMSYLKIDSAIINQISSLLKSINLNLADYIGPSFGYLPIVVVSLCLGVILLRLILPGGPAFVILMSALVPIVVQAGISPWVLGFILLTISEGFILPHQHGVYTQIISELESRDLKICYNPRDVLITNLFLMGLRIVAICVTLLYWKQLAII